MLLSCIWHDHGQIVQLLAAIQGRGAPKSFHNVYLVTINFTIDKSSTVCLLTFLKSIVQVNFSVWLQRQEMNHSIPGAID